MHDEVVFSPSSTIKFNLIFNNVETKKKINYIYAICL